MIFGFLLMVKRHLLAFVSDLGLRFTNRSLTPKYKTIYVDRRRQNSFDEFLSGHAINPACQTKFRWGDYFRFVLIGYFGWTSLEGRYQLSLIFRWFANLLTRYELNRAWYQFISWATQPVWVFWFVLTNQKEIEIEFFKQRMFLNYYTSNLVLNFYGGLFGDYYEEWFRNPINNRKQPLWFYARWRWYQRWLPFWLFFNPRLVYCRAMLYRLRDYCFLPGGLYRNHHWLVERFFSNRYLNFNTYYVQKQIVSLLGFRVQNLNRWVVLQRELKKKHLKNRRRAYRFLLKVRRRFHRTNNRSFQARIIRRAAKSTYHKTRRAVRFLFTSRSRLGGSRFVKKMKKLQKKRLRFLFRVRQKLKLPFFRTLISNVPLQEITLEKKQILTQVDPLQFDQILSDHTFFGDDHLTTFEDQQDDELGAGDEPEHENFHYGMMGSTDFETTYTDRRKRPKITRRLRRRRMIYDRYRRADHIQYLARVQRSYLHVDPQWVPTPEQEPNLDHQRLLSSGDGPSAVDREYQEEEIEVQQHDLDYLQDWALLRFSPLTLNEMSDHDGNFNWFFNWNQTLDRRLNLGSTRFLLHNSKQLSSEWFLTSKNMLLKKKNRPTRFSLYKFARMSRNHLLLGFRRRQKYFLPRFLVAEFVPLRFRKKTNFKFFRYYTSKSSTLRQVRKRTGLKFIPRRVKLRLSVSRKKAQGWRVWFSSYFRSRAERLNHQRLTPERSPVRHYLFPFSLLTLGENKRQLPTRAIPRRQYFHQYRVNSFFDHRYLNQVQIPGINFWLVVGGLAVVDDWYTSRFDHDLESRPWLSWPWYNLWSWSTRVEGYSELNHGIRLTQYEHLPTRFGFQRWAAPNGWSTFGEGRNTWSTQFRFLHQQGFNYQPEIPYYSPKMSTFLSGRGLTDWYNTEDFGTSYHYYFAPIFPMPGDIRYFQQNDFSHVEQQFFNGAYPLHYKMFYQIYVRTYNTIFHDLMFHYGAWLQTRYDPLNFTSWRYTSQPTTVGPRLIPALQALLGNQMESGLPHFEILGLQHWGYHSRLNLPRSAARYYQFELLQVCSPWEIKLNSALIKEWSRQAQGIETFQPLPFRVGVARWWSHLVADLQHLTLDDNSFLRVFLLAVVPTYLVTRYKKLYLSVLAQRMTPFGARLKITQRMPVRARLVSTSAKIIQKRPQKKYKFHSRYRSAHAYSFTLDPPEDFSLRYIKTDDLPAPPRARLSAYRVRRGIKARTKLRMLIGSRYLDRTSYERIYFISGYSKFKAYKYGTLLYRSRFQPVVKLRPRSTTVVERGRNCVARCRRPPSATTIYRAGLTLRLMVRYRAATSKGRQSLQLVRPGNIRAPGWWIKPSQQTRLVYPRDVHNRSENKKTQHTRNSNIEWYKPYLEDEREIMGERHFFYHDDAEQTYVLDRQYRKKIFQGQFGHGCAAPVQVPRTHARDPLPVVTIHRVSPNLVVQQNLHHQHLLNNFDQSLFVPGVITPQRVTLVYNMCDHLRGVKFPGHDHHPSASQPYLFAHGDTDYQDQQFYGENGDEDQNQNFILQSDSLFGEYHLEYLHGVSSSLVEVFTLGRSSPEARARQNLTSYRRFGSLALVHYRLSYPMVTIQEGLLTSEVYWGTYSVDHPGYQLLSLTTYHQPITYRRLARSSANVDLGYIKRNEYRYYFDFEQTSLPNPDQSWPNFERVQAQKVSHFNSDFPVINPRRTLELETLDYGTATYEYLNQVQTLMVDLTRDAAYVLTDQEVQNFTPLSEAYNFSLIGGSSLYFELLLRPTMIGAGYQKVLHPAGLNLGRELISTQNLYPRENTYLEMVLTTYHEGYDLHTYYGELQIDWSYHTDTVDDPDYEEEEDLTEVKSFDLPLGVARYPLTTHAASSLSTYQRLTNTHLSTTLDYLMRLKVESRRKLAHLNRYRPYRFRRLSSLARRQQRLARLIPKRTRSQTGLLTRYQNVNHFQTINVGDLNSIELSDEWLMTNFFTFWSLTELYYNDTPNGYTTGY